MLTQLEARFAAWVSRLGWESLHIWLITLLAATQAVIFLVIVPPWQHYDEPAHFRFAWSRAHLDPSEQDAFFTPLDPTMVRETLGSMMEHGFYEVEVLPIPNYLRTHGIDTLGHSQSNEFPLYYDFLTWPLASLRFADITTQLIGSRAVTALFFLLSIWACIGLMRVLTRPGHTLRWLVPTCLALVAPLVDISTAVNNDAAAIAGFSLFLWGAVHGLAARRLTGWHVIWIAAAMAFTVMAKQALLFVAPLAPLVLLIGLWQHRQWPWRWFWLVLLCVTAGGALATIRMHSTAYWTTRWLPDSPGRVRHENAVHGRYAMPVLVNYETLYQRMPQSWIKAHPEHLLNFGAWVWSDEPVTVPVLGFAFVTEGANFMFTEVLDGGDLPEITSEPQFVLQQFWVPREAEILYIFLWPYTLIHQDTGNRVYYDGLVLMEGVVDVEQIPTYVDGNPRYIRWGDREGLNLARNPSGETPWPNFHRQIDTLLEDRTAWNPTSILHRILDVQWSGHVLWVQQPKFMLLNLFNRLAWGKVNLPGPLWGPLTLILVALGLAGCGLYMRALILRPAPAGSGFQPGVVYGFLACCLLLIWIGADLWIVKFMWMDNLHLSDIRYTFPALAIMVLMVTAGVRHLSARLPALHRRLPGLLAGVFLLYNLAAIWAYVDTFAFLP